MKVIKAITTLFDMKSSAESLKCWLKTQSKAITIRFTSPSSSILVIFWLTFLSLPKGSHQGPHERRLLKKLLEGYDILERPVANESEPLLVSFGLTLQQIIDVDEKNQILTSNTWLNMDEKNQLLIANMWLKLEWVDTNMRWTPSEYGNVQDLRITPDRIWKPDVLMYNSADEKFDATYHSNVVVRNNGSCSYIPPGIFKSTCKIDITWFPFDDQRCTMKFGSWTYDGSALDLRLPEKEGDTSSYTPNGEWVLIGVTGERNVVEYACCPAPYIDITFTVHIRRRTLYYGLNLIIPCVIISSMTLLGFTLPPDSGEKLTLGVTILLSMTVFLLQLAEIMPATSETVSIIGTYFACIMIMVAFSVVMTVIVLNFHHRTVEHQDMPQWIRTVLLKWLPWLLRMEKPGKLKPPRRRHHSNTSNPSPSKHGITSISNKMKDFEQFPATRTHITNTMDGDDDFIQMQINRRNCASGGCNCYSNTNRNSSSYHHNYIHHGADDTDMSTAPFSDTTNTNNYHHNCCREMSPIIRELCFITNRMRRDDEIHELIGEWKFAAMVVDRLCLILFSAFAAVSAAVCLLSAPHLIV